MQHKTKRPISENSIIMVRFVPYFLLGFVDELSVCPELDGPVDPEMEDEPLVLVDDDPEMEDEPLVLVDDDPESPPSPY